MILSDPYNADEPHETMTIGGWQIPLMVRVCVLGVVLAGVFLIAVGLLGLTLRLVRFIAGF